MFRSIRTNLFTAFLGLLSLFLISVLVINVFFLDDIFIFGSRQAMEKAFSELKESAGSGTLSEDVVDEYAFRSGLFLGVFSADGVMAYNAGLPRWKRDGLPEHVRTEPIVGNPEKQQITSEVEGLFQRYAQEAQTDGLFFTENKTGGRNSLVLMGKLENGQILVMMKPVMPLKESSQVATIFILVSGAIVLLAGSIGVFLVSGRVTAPILAMDRVARKMADLDFSEAVAISNRDELGTLGSSLQSMSDRLSTALQDLEKANARLLEDIERERRLDQMRRRFISNVSHELRTPLSMIQGYADGLRHGVAQDPEQIGDYCDVIVEETKRMNALIKDMLDLSSYDAGAFSVRVHPLDLMTLVKTSLERYQVMFAKHTVSLTADGPETCPVTGDGRRIEQALTNFLTNALRHTPEGGEVRIHVGMEGDTVCLEVFNSGSHISEQELESIWQPFNRGIREQQSDASGFGLGLAIVQAIAQAHQGSSYAQNTEGGVVFGIVWKSEPEPA